MKFTVEKSLLLTAINTTSRASAAKSAVPALEGLLIETLENGGAYIWLRPENRYHHDGPG